MDPVSIWAGVWVWVWASVWEVTLQEDQILAGQTLEEVLLVWEE